MTLEECKRQHIEQVLEKHDGNRTKAALELGMARTTLIKWAKKYEMPAPEFYRYRRRPGTERGSHERSVSADSAFR